VWPHIQIEHVKQPLCQHLNQFKAVEIEKNEYLIRFKSDPKDRQALTED
jgi:hypothetical protein